MMKHPTLGELPHGAVLNPIWFPLGKWEEDIGSDAPLLPLYGSCSE
jgi:hypothetical protein